MCEMPFVEHREGDGAHSTVGGACFDVIEQPLIESMRLGVFARGLFEQLAPQGQAYGIGRLVAFSGTAAAVGRVQGRQQASANMRRAQCRDRCAHDHHRSGAAGCTGLAAANDAPIGTPWACGRRKPRSNAAKSNSTLAKSVTKISQDGVGCRVVNDFR